MENKTQSSASGFYDDHYNKMPVQPIEIMQFTLDPEQFEGYLMASIIKYHLRAGKKDGEPKEKDLAKRDRYISWHLSFLDGHKINPRLDMPVPEVIKEKYIANLDARCRLVIAALKNIGDKRNEQ